MLNEAKIFLEALTHFRQLLNEGIGQGPVVDAIQKHKIVYIYYAGDNTIMKGYRTIKPMVLGYSKSKESLQNPYMLLRAWEEAGSSDSKKMYADQKGRMKYGWRLFRVDKITSFLPTGKIFSTEETKFPDIESYNPNDSQMRDIIAAVEVSGDKPKLTQRGATIAQKIKPIPGQEKKPIQYITKAGNAQREASKEEIEHLWAIAKGIKKKSPQQLMVVTDEHGDMVLKDENLRSKYPPNAIVGNLKNLYISLVKPNEKVDNSFFQKVENNAVKETMKKENIERKTFFK